MELGQDTRAPIVRVLEARHDDRGYAMAALLVGLSVMAVLMSAALPVWSHYAKREREEELIWRGQQYARAIGLFQRKYANTFPPNVDLLVEQKFLRKKYKDPITNDDFQLIPATGGTTGAVQPPRGGQQGALGRQALPQPVAPQQPQTPIGRGGAPSAMAAPSAFAPAIGIQGVVSKSTESSIKIYNGRTKYNEWMFVYLASAQRLAPGGVQGQGPGQMVRPGQVQMPNGGFAPFGGTDRRPGVGPGMGPGGARGQPPPFGQPPTQPPFGQPFGQPPFGQPPTGQPPFGRPPVPQPPQRPPGG